MRYRTWTDDDLRAAVAVSRTLSEVLARLGLARGGATLAPVRNRMLQLGLSLPEVPGHERSSAAWDADPTALRAAAPKGRRTWTDDDLRAAVAVCRSIAGVLRALGLKPGGSVYVVMRRTIAELRLDTSHFTGQGWARGRRDNPFNTPTRPLSEILVEGSDYIWTNELRKRLLKAGLKDSRCEICGLDEWNGLPIPLQLDHVNGDRTDNRIENLRILCPNCHAQTDTWCGKNIGRGGRSGIV